MKKIALFICMACVALGMSAQTITGSSLITLKSAGVADKEVGFLLSTSFSNGWDNTWDATPAQAGGIYVYYQQGKYSMWASNEYSKNLALAFDANDNTAYTLKFSSFQGQTYKIKDLVANAEFEVNASTPDYEFTIDASLKNQSILDRFVINYEEPAPACTTVRNNLVVNRYYTICLPQAVASANGASFWDMSKRGEGVAYLEEAELPLVAGRPYIFQAEAEELCVTLSGDPVNGAGSFGALVGTFATMDQNDLDYEANYRSSDIYLLFNNELWKVNDQNDNSLAANRAYIVYNNFVVENPAPAPGRRVRAIPMANNVPTAVENINAAEAPAKTIIDGKMYIIRGEQMYDATGRMVK